MILNFVFGYLGISMAWVWGFFVFHYSTCPKHSMQIKRLWSKSRIGLGMGVVCATLFLTVISPILGPVMMFEMLKAFWECRKEIQLRRRVFRMHRELVMEPIHDLNLPEATLKFFEEQSVPLKERGYKCLGNFLLKGEPAKMTGRLHLDAAFMTFVEINEYFNEFNLELISILENGVVICTYCGKENETAKELVELTTTGSYILHFVGDLKLAAMLSRHKAFLDAKSAELKSPVCKIEEASWQDFYRYHHEYFGQKMFEIGHKDAPPAIAPQLPRAVGVHALACRKKVRSV